MRESLSQLNRTYDHGTLDLNKNEIPSAFVADRQVFQMSTEPPLKDLDQAVSPGWRMYAAQVLWLRAI